VCPYGNGHGHGHGHGHGAQLAQVGGDPSLHVCPAGHVRDPASGECLRGSRFDVEKARASSGPSGGELVLWALAIGGVGYLAWYAMKQQRQPWARRR
jgi:hypothetical protein